MQGPSHVIFCTIGILSCMNAVAQYEMSISRVVPFIKVGTMQMAIMPSPFSPSLTGRVVRENKDQVNQSIGSIL